MSLAWLGFPGWVLFVGLLPLLLLDDYFVREQSRFTSVSYWGHVYLAFLVWNGLATWWVMHATPVGAVLVVFLNSFLMSLVFWLAHLMRRRTQGNLGYLAYVVFWLSFEYFHYHWEIEWPWLTLGNGFANNVKVVQWYEFTGVLGGSLWVWMVNLLLFGVLRRYAASRRLKTVRWQVAMLGFVVLLPVIYSLYRYNAYSEKEDPREIVVVQPNIDPYSEQHDDAAVNDKLEKFIRLAEAEITPTTDFIVGPETVFEQQWEEENIPLYPQFSRLAGLTAASPHAALIIGASTYHIYREGEKVPASARLMRDGITRYDYYNSAIFTDKAGRLQVYHKSILVSGVEKMPFRKYLRFLEKFIIDLGGTTGSLGIQPEPTNFITSDSTQVATLICYESAFGGYLARFVRKGAGLVFIITNDGWWKNTPGYRQHFSFSRLRAIETRRSIARAANTGISGFINQRGDVLQQTSWWKEAVIHGQINVNNELTFYVKNGDYLARISLFASVLLILFLISLSLRGDKKSPHQF